jgi:hypothetical protein
MPETGAFLFGAVIGWVTYFTMRYSSNHALSDIATVIGAIGGAAVLGLFPAQSSLFAAYGTGLGIGFFTYIFILIVATVLTKGLAGLDEQDKKKNWFVIVFTVLIKGSTGLADEREKKNPFMGG